MAQSEGTTGKLILRVNSSFADEAPGGIWFEVPFVSENLEANKKVETSKIIRSDAQIKKNVFVAMSSGGDVSIELTKDSYYEKVLECLFRKQPVTISYVAATISFLDSDNSINDSANSFPLTITPGQWLKVSGAATPGNNGVAKVITATASKIVLSEASAGGVTFVDGLAGPSITISGKIFRNGIEEKDLAIEKQFEDIGLFDWGTGFRVSKHDLSIQAEQIVTGSFTVTGKKLNEEGAIITSLSDTGTVNDSEDNPIFSASGNVGYVLLDNTVLTIAVKSASFSLTNNATRYKPVIGSLFPIDIGYGNFQGTGSLEAYFEDNTFLEKHRTHSLFSLVFKLIDDDGNIFIYSFPKCTLDKASDSNQGQNTDIMNSLSFMTEHDPNTNTMFQVDVL